MMMKRVGQAASMAVALLAVTAVEAAAREHLCAARTEESYGSATAYILTNDSFGVRGGTVVWELPRIGGQGVLPAASLDFPLASGNWARGDATALTVTHAAAGPEQTPSAIVLTLDDGTSVRRAWSEASAPPARPGGHPAEGKTVRFDDPQLLSRLSGSATVGVRLVDESDATLSRSRFDLSQRAVAFRAMDQIAATTRDLAREGHLMCRPEPPSDS